MQNTRNKTLFILAGLFIVLFMVDACRKDTSFIPPPPPPPPPPFVAQNTKTLEASYYTGTPLTVSSPYWTKTNYHEVTTTNMSTGQNYTIGSYTEPNMTGTLNGLTSFNGGTTPPGLTLKAAYDKTNIYILAEWTDTRLDVSYKSWGWNGPVIVGSPDTVSGWFSQHNSDRLAFAFQIDSAYSGGTYFSQSGCAASCHTVSGNPVMYPASGSVDIWEWSKALSAPLGYANDMVATSTGLTNDAGTPTYTRNGTSDTSGPMYEWNGTAQVITLPNSTTYTLNPAFYLYSPDMTSFAGNMRRGDSIYHNGNIGQCYSCHGEHGESSQYYELNNDINLCINTKAQMESTVLPSLSNYSTMQPYWEALTTSQQTDALAYLQGLVGHIPGNYLQEPSGSAADITAYDNVSALEINSAFTQQTSIKYKVLIIRKLNTSNGDDAQFIGSPGKTYPFGVALMDNDGKNHIGSQVETLTFK